MNCDMSDNYVIYTAGGMVIHSSTVEVDDCEFSSNTALYEYGGGLCVLNSTSSVIKSCIFSENSAGVLGGGLHAMNGSDVVVIGSLFLANISDNYGGGLSTSSDSEATALNTSFLGNRCDVFGGGAFLDGPAGGHSSTFVNCLFSGNRSDDCGGGIYSGEDRRLVVTNATFSLNGADGASGDGGGLYIDYSGDAVIGNSIFWENSDSTGTGETAQILNNGALAIDFSCVQGWTGSFGGTGNFGYDPQFTDADGPDDIAGTEDDDLHFPWKNYCCNSGENSILPSDDYDLDGDGDFSEYIPFDLNGEKRITFPHHHGVVDRGALEMPPPDRSLSGAYQS